MENTKEIKSHFRRRYMVHNMTDHPTLILLSHSSKYCYTRTHEGLGDLFRNNNNGATRTEFTALLSGAEVVRAQGCRGGRDGDVVVRAGVVGAEGFTALLGGAEVTRAQRRLGVWDGSEAVGAGVAGAERLAALFDQALAGALDFPGVFDGSKAVRAPDEVTVQRPGRLSCGGGRSGRSSGGGSGRSSGRKLRRSSERSSRTISCGIHT